MKLKSTLLIAILAVFVASSASVFAAEASHDATKVEKIGTEKTEAAKTGKSKAKKPVKKHSHMEEKTGMPMAESKPETGKDVPKDRHDHTKDRH